MRNLTSKGGFGLAVALCLVGCQKEGVTLLDSGISPGTGGTSVPGSQGGADGTSAAGGAGGLATGGASGQGGSTGGVGGVPGTGGRLALDGSIGLGGNVGAGGSGTGGASGDGGAQQVDGGASCTDLQNEYAAALPAARSCDLAAVGQCQQLVSSSLSPCFVNCMTYVNDASILNKIKLVWQQGGCNSLVGMVCPAIACIAPTAGACTATDGGSSECTVQSLLATPAP